MKKTDDSIGYFQMIAEYVRRKRISPILLSSSEGQILLDWENKGIPIDVALHSIDLGYEKFKKSEKSKIRKGFNLKACKSIAIKEWQKFLEVQSLSKDICAEGNVGIEKIRVHFDTIKTKIAELKNNQELEPFIDRIADDIISKTDGILKTFERDQDIEKMLEDLKITEGNLLERLISNLDSMYLDRGFKSAETVLGGYRGRMDQATFNKTYHSFLRSWLKKDLSLPDFSISCQNLEELTE